MTPPAIGIAGAGIAGLTAALALAARGYRVEIFERAERLETVGAGLQLSPNASRVLIALGLHDALAARATLLDGIRIHSTRSGDELTIIPLNTKATADPDTPYWVIHRADLQAVLLDAVRAHGGIALHLGSCCEEIFVDAQGVTLTFGGDKLKFDAWIGADGVRSSVRRRVCDVTPEFSGRVAWRGMVDAEKFACAPAGKFVDLWMGADAHLVTYPIANGARINLVAIRRGDADASYADMSPNSLAHADWPAQPRALVEACGPLTPYPLYTMPKLPRWTSGPLALIGDAAHAMLPFAAQGAAMAIEDAAVLAACLGDARSLSQDEIAGALARFHALRRDRVARVAAIARQSGRIFHLSGAMAAARDFAIRALGGERLSSRQNWIYGWRLTQ